MKKLFIIIIGAILLFVIYILLLAGEVSAKSYTWYEQRNMSSIDKIINGGDLTRYVDCLRNEDTWSEPCVRTRLTLALTESLEAVQRLKEMNKYDKAKEEIAWRFSGTPLAEFIGMVMIKNVTVEPTETEKRSYCVDLLLNE